MTRRLANTAVFLTFFLLAVTSFLGKTPTFDEQGFLVRGLGYVRGDNTHMRVGHPAGLNAWNALLLRDDPTVALPLDDPSWQTTAFHQPAELFMWELGNDVRHVMFASRIMTVFLGMLLLAVVSRWAAEMSTRPWIGTFVLVLVAFDPNVLAHTRLTTTDLGLTLGTAVAGYTLWRYLIQPTWQRALVAGIGFGLLANTKFTMGLFVPLFALVILLTWAYSFWQTRRAHLPVQSLSATRFTIDHSPFTIRKILQFTIIFPTAAILTLWAMYGFDIGTLPADLPALPQLSGLTLPLAHHLEQLLDIGNRAQIGAPAFLLGDYRDTGWWYYFPIAFLTKTPLPTLILLLIATLTLLLRLRSPFTIHHALRQFTINLLTLLIPPLGYFALALTTTVNLGYRHLLPMWPFLWVLIGYGMAQGAGDKVQGAGFRGQGARPTTYYLLLTTYFLLPLWLILITFAIHPHYLAYFNVLAGGPNNGWRVLVDSNLDWGQDLAGLAEWQRENGAGTLWLSYFGEGRPDYYGLDYRGLDSFPPRLMNPYANPFYPADPAPGLYAISATNLQGVHFENHDQFAWFREREPIAKIGYSIFLYDVPARGEPAALALPLGMDMSNLPAELHAPLATNDVRPSWYEPSRSLLIPAQNG
ncbi:MAG: glycosyltransferase family 39 protein, partial [Anaerolineales bacterium]|nr:glycosyltransferase family 39 protein [Anaerolineales bacterium]